MSKRIAVLQNKMNFLRQKPHVYELIAAHGGVGNLTDLETLNNEDLGRLQRYVDYYYGIVTFPA